MIGKLAITFVSGEHCITTAGIRVVGGIAFFFADFLRGFFFWLPGREDVTYHHVQLRIVP